MITTLDPVCYVVESQLNVCLCGNRWTHSTLYAVRPIKLRAHSRQEVRRPINPTLPRTHEYRPTAHHLVCTVCFDHPVDAALATTPVIDPSRAHSVYNGLARSEPSTPAKEPAFVPDVSNL